MDVPAVTGSTGSTTPRARCAGKPARQRHRTCAGAAFPAAPGWCPAGRRVAALHCAAWLQRPGATPSSATHPRPRWMQRGTPPRPCRAAGAISVRLSRSRPAQRAPSGFPTSRRRGRAPYPAATVRTGRYPRNKAAPCRRCARPPRSWPLPGCPGRNPCAMNRSGRAAGSQFRGGAAAHATRDPPKPAGWEGRWRYRDVLRR